ncbi:MULTISPECIES: histidine kinase [unclassified Rhodococcus (in: high G+C Gram-positive bacteria)]|uniref:sensor histidine kinase n=1 Tax=Rhodococcus sp. SJ-3 TaxID=3454628 RepID=UPI003F794E35
MTESGRTDEDPWARFGWFMATVWLLFLIYPLSEVVTTGSALGRTLGSAGIAAFAIVYIHGFRSLYTEKAPPARIAAIHLPLLVLLICAVSLHIGTAALGMGAFVVSFAMFTLTFVPRMIVLAVVAAVCLLVPWWNGTLRDDFFYTLIVVLVGGITAVIRAVGDRDDEYNALRNELVIADERDRVARDVHDVLGHSLTAVTVKAELAERLVDVDPQRAKAELAAIRSLTREALGEVRATVTGLRVARLGDELDRAGTALGDAGIDVEIRGDASVVDPRYRLVLGWVLREAVTNVVRHSNAYHCKIDLDGHSLRVTDDGVGTDGIREGNGLRGLRDRVRSAGGKFTVGTGPAGAGTELKVEFG